MPPARRTTNARGYTLQALSRKGAKHKADAYRSIRRLEARESEKVGYRDYLRANPTYAKSAGRKLSSVFVTKEIAQAKKKPVTRQFRASATDLVKQRIILNYKLIDVRLVDILRRFYPNGLVDIFIPKALYDTATAFDVETHTAGRDMVIETGITVKAAVDRFIKDLHADGFATKLYLFETGNHVDIRASMQDDQTDALVGAIMIGSTLPMAWYEMDDDFHGAHSEFPIDLYFMDLGGTWTDSDGDGMFDGHSGTPNPDVWVGRIVGNLPTTGKTEAQLVVEYLSRNHYFRVRDTARFPQQLFTGIGSNVHYRALAYHDDDWSGGGDSNYLDGQLTHERILVNSSTGTSAVDYLTRISERPGGFWYQHQMIHSGSTSLSFKTGSGWDADGVTNNELNTTFRRAHFYNLFDCSGARYVVNNFLGGLYVVANPYGLGAVGSTKTGSMRGFEVYYANLCGTLRPEHSGMASDWEVVVGQRQRFGTAYLKWCRWVASGGYTQDERQWHYGMTYIGDPTLFPYWDLNRGKA